MNRSDWEHRFVAKLMSQGLHERIAWEVLRDSHYTEDEQKSLDPEHEAAIGLSDK